MKVGFTGTRKGMTTEQHSQFVWLVRKLEEEAEQGVREFHHGDCKGSDEMSHRIIKRVLRLGSGAVWIHPAQDARWRAFCVAPPEQMLDPRPPLDRNQDIVDASDVMIATPGEMEEVLRSGTWATIRRARKARKPLYIIFPDGSIQEENNGSS